MNRVCIVVLSALIASVAFFAAGCHENGTAVSSISSILANPNSYINRQVDIGGNVTRTYGGNLSAGEANAYQLDDGTGKIWVITKNAVPNQGQQVGVRGTVSTGATRGREQFGPVFIREEARSEASGSNLPPGTSGRRRPGRR